MKFKFSRIKDLIDSEESDWNFILKFLWYMYILWNEVKLYKTG